MRQTLTELFRSVSSRHRTTVSPRDLPVPFPIVFPPDTAAPTHEQRSSAEREFCCGNVMIW